MRCYFCFVLLLLGSRSGECDVVSLCVLCCSVNGSAFLCVACLTVFVICFGKTIRNILGVFVILLLNVMLIQI